MATTKIYDLAVVTGEYQGRDGIKKRWKNVGAVMQKEDGGKFIMLDRTFNPAGVPFKEGGESILLSMFEPKDKQQAQQRVQETFSDDIPFAVALIPVAALLASLLRAGGVA